MITEIRVSNFRSINDNQIQVNFVANNKSTRFYSNLKEINDKFKIMKNVVIFEKYETTKSDIIEAVKILKDIFERKYVKDNYSNDSNLSIKLGISFVNDSDEVIDIDLEFFEDLTIVNQQYKQNNRAVEIPQVFKESNLLFMGFDFYPEILNFFNKINIINGAQITENKYETLKEIFRNVIERQGILLINGMASNLNIVLSRQLACVFNTSRNDRAQLLFTTTDISFLDIGRLYRQEQIYFTDNDEERSYYYSLTDINSDREDPIRNGADLVKLYRQGFLAGIPEFTLVDEIYKGEES